MDMEKVRANRVVQGIKDMIVNGELTPGARYPSERVLAQRFGSEQKYRAGGNSIFCDGRGSVYKARAPGPILSMIPMP